MPDTSTETNVSGTDATNAPEGTGQADASNTLSEVELARRRQAGAEKARAEAAEQLAQANAELERLRSSKPGENSAVDVEKAIKAALDAQEAKWNERLKTETSKVQAAALDAKFPAARARFPEVTDSVKLAELEGLFGETTEPPTPVGNNAAKTASAPVDIESMSQEDLRAYIESLDPSVAGIQRQS
jgi:hypothetical protein